MATHVENATQVGEHLVDGQAQFIQIQAGGATQGVKETESIPQF